MIKNKYTLKEIETLKAKILNAKIMLSQGKSRYEDGRKVEVELTKLKTQLRELEGK